MLRPFVFDAKNKTRDTLKNFKHMRAEKYLSAISEEGISCNGPNPEGLIKHIFATKNTDFFDYFGENLDVFKNWIVHYTKLPTLEKLRRLSS